MFNNLRISIIDYCVRYILCLITESYYRLKILLYSSVSTFLHEKKDLPYSTLTGFPLGKSQITNLVTYKNFFCIMENLVYILW